MIFAQDARGPCLVKVIDSPAMDLLYFEHGNGPERCLIKIIDSPGHVVFAEMTASLRITDGAIVVVGIEGCTFQTEIVLLRAVQEHVRPCLFVNKVDRCILELQMEAEDMYVRFRSAIENVNKIISTATSSDALMDDVQVQPQKGTVAFGSALDGWGFTIERFAQIYARKHSASSSWAPSTSSCKLS